MFQKISSKLVFPGMVGLMAALAILWADARTVRAQELDESLKVNGEVAIYFESVSTNFAGDYNPDKRGTGNWSGYFGGGLKDSYSFNETRFKEAEVKFDKATKMGEDWVMVNHVELEFKTVNTLVEPADIDLEEASAKFRNSSGLYVDMGILQDAHVYTPALLLDMAAGDDKGFDENPAFRVGYKMGDMDVNLRYTSQFVPTNKDKDTIVVGQDDAGADVTAGVTKSIQQTMIHAELMYKVPDFLNALVYYTSITSANKENKDFQSKDSEYTGKVKTAFEDKGLNDTTVMAVSLAFQFGTIIPYVNVESWTTDLDAGAKSYDTQIITLGVNLQQLGPGDLIVATEQGTMTGDFYFSPKTGKAADVAFSGYGAEYLFHTGKSLHGPGFKSFSNDAPDAESTLSGTVIYYGSKWVF